MTVRLERLHTVLGSIGPRVCHTPARMPDLRRSYHRLGSSAAATGIKDGFTRVALLSAKNFSMMTGKPPGVYRLTRSSPQVPKRKTSDEFLQQNRIQSPLAPQPLLRQLQHAFDVPGRVVDVQGKAQDATADR